jgi:uracil-DNA glycosylase
MTIANKQITLPTKIDPKKIQIVAVCEALPKNKNDYFYSSTDSSYVVNTIGAFNNAGIKAKSINDIIQQGVYLTVAVKEIREGVTVPSEIIEKYSYDLEEELNMFPNIKAIILMGDAAIKAINYISKRKTKTKVIPSGSTYKIRGGKFYFDNIRVFPSYLPTGKNFLIEKTKRKMVAEDIKSAFELLK